MILTISKIKKSLKTIALAAALALPLSCFNSALPLIPEKPAANSGQYGLYATITGESARTAIPSWPGTPVYYIEYSTLSDWNDETTHIVKTPSTDPSAFTVDANGNATNFYLPLSNGTWVVQAGVKDGTTKQLTATKSFPLTPEEPVATETFFLQMPVTEDGTGSIELQVEAESGSGINFVEMIIQCSNNTSITATKSGGGPYTFTASNIPNGKQKIVINAYESYDNTGNQLYSSVQDVIIYAGLTTNHWLINGSNPTGNKYTITSQMVADYLPHQFYVDSTEGLDTNSGLTKNFPFQTMTKAISAIQDRNETNEFTIHVKDGSSFENGSCTIIQQSIKIECWKNVPNDMLGSATWTLNSDGTDTNGSTPSLQIGYGTGRGKLTIVSANDTCGLTLNGKNEDHTCIKIDNGDFIMDGGKITGFGNPDNPGTNSYGAVYMYNLDSGDSKRRVFTMRKGEISGNRAIIPGVNVGMRTSFFMEGGKIINNLAWDNGFAVADFGNMYISGLVQIGGTASTDNTSSNGSKANLILEKWGSPEAMRTLTINGSLSTGAHIGVSADFVQAPSPTNSVAITTNYTNNEPPSAFFNYDSYSDSNPYVLIRSTQSGSIGEVALARGGGSIKSARDLDFTFELYDDADNKITIPSLIVNQSTHIKVKPVVKLGNTTLYYKSGASNEESSDKIYTDSVYTNKFSDFKVIWQERTLSMYGTNLSDPYVTYAMPDDWENEFYIPGMPYTGTYTLTISAVYMGIKYSANFDFVCNAP